MSLSLDQVLEDGEGQRIEFKESLALTDKGAEALVAFANAQGGQVFFGITDDCKPKGVLVGSNTIGELVVGLDRHIFPPLPMDVATFPVGPQRIVHTGVRLAWRMPKTGGMAPNPGQSFQRMRFVRNGELAAAARCARRV